jgi:hypothetical protein
MIKQQQQAPSLEQQIELENIIQDLEEENSFLMEEYNRLQTELNKTNSNRTSSHNQKYKSATLNSRASSHRSKYNKYMNENNLNGNHSPELSNSMNNSRAMSSSPTNHLMTTALPGSQSRHGSGSQYSTLTRNVTNQFYSSNGSTATSTMNRLTNLFAPQNTNNTQLTAKIDKKNFSNSSVLIANGNQNNNNNSQQVKDQQQMLNEARMLRQHEDRLEARMRILENHNRLLDTQLKQLKGLLNVRIFSIFLLHFLSYFLTLNDLL